MPAGGDQVGVMVERLVVLTATPLLVAVTSLTSSGTLATATTGTPHGYSSRDTVTIAGAVPAGYTGNVLITVTGLSTFTYAVASGLTTPATGVITALYDHDAQGGRKATYTTLATIWAEMVPLGANERLQLAAMQSTTLYRFRVRRRVDVTATMKVRWTASWPKGQPTRTLEITGVVPEDLAYMTLDCADSAPI